MADRLRAKVSLRYPAPEHLAMVREAGGFSKLPPDAVVTVRRIEPGDYCDDLPDDMRALYLERGYVEIVDEPPPSRRPKR